MQRFFLCHDDDLPAGDESWGNWHFIALDSHGTAGTEWNVVTLLDGHIQPKDAWLAFPSLYDGRTTLRQSNVIPEQLLADLGLTGDETTADAMLVFGAIHPSMMA